MKTMIVFTKFRVRETDEWTEGYEYAEIGEEAENPSYKTGKDFIDAIRKMYRVSGWHHKITNVVIG